MINSTPVRTDCMNATNEPTVTPFLRSSTVISFRLLTTIALAIVVAGGCDGLHRVNLSDEEAAIHRTAYRELGRFYGRCSVGGGSR